MKNRPQATDTLRTNYIEAFKSAYPQKSIDVRRAQGGYRVVIDGDAGDRTLDATDMAAGITGFKAHGTKPLAFGRFPLGGRARFVN